ncbi:MAG TPA: TlpA disulfide reductase family protein [Longimicrobiales bacterium]|nr:TlpA disulfide reductase family protein [Longimicrobiales bacterium]
MFQPRAVLPVVVLLTACAGEEAYRPLRAGDEAPAYAAPTLDGDTVALAGLRGRPVLLNVWATWCAPCREEMPGLQALHERYAARGLHVIGASIDARGAESAVRRFVQDYGITFTILHDVSELVSHRFRTRSVPETFLIGADGRIVQRWIGRIDPLSADVLARVEAALE